MAHTEYGSISTSAGSVEISSNGDAAGYIKASKSLWAKLMQTWICELTGFLISLGCLLATAVLLRAYDGRQIPNWPVTLNFVLSVLGNIGFASSMFGIHATIAQLKWIWFAKSPRSLADFGVFQKARGGAVGIFQLLYTTGAQYVTS